MAGLGNDFNTEDPVGFTSEEYEEEAVQSTSEGWGCDRCHICGRLYSSSGSCETRPSSDEYETDSEDDFSDIEDKDIAHITVSRSGRPIRAHFGLDL